MSKKKTNQSTGNPAKTEATKLENIRKNIPNKDKAEAFIKARVARIPRRKVKK